MPSCPLCEEFILGTDALVVHLHLEHQEFQERPFGVFVNYPNGETYVTACPCGFISGVPVDIKKMHVESFRFAIKDLHDHLIANGGIEQHIKEMLVRKALSEDSAERFYSSDNAFMWSKAGLNTKNMNLTSYGIIANAIKGTLKLFAPVLPIPKYFARFKDLP